MSKSRQMTPAFSALESLSLNADQIDCAFAVMLKILDGKCKMPSHEKIIMEDLYDILKVQDGHHLGDSHHALIKEARTMRDEGELDEEMIEKVYEHRLYAETMISRPVMKHFKASLRDVGILPKKNKVMADV